MARWKALEPILQDVAVFLSAYRNRAQYQVSVEIVPTCSICIPRFLIDFATW
jgi:hypothetical protein